MSLRDITSKLAKEGFNTTVGGFDAAISFDSVDGYTATISIEKEMSCIIVGFAHGRNVKTLQLNIMNIVTGQDYTPNGMRKLAGNKNGRVNLSDLVNVQPTKATITTTNTKKVAKSVKSINTPNGQFASIHAAAKAMGSYYSVIKNRVESAKDNGYSYC